MNNRDIIRAAAIAAGVVTEEELNRMQQAGSLIGIPVEDHIITGRSGDYYSFSDHGILPERGQILQTAAE